MLALEYLTIPSAILSYILEYTQYTLVAKNKPDKKIEECEKWENQKTDSFSSLGI